MDSPLLDARATSSSWARKCRIFLALGEQLERAEDGQAGADQGEELLVEDEEGIELDLLRLAGAGEQAAGFDGVDVVAGLGEAGAQLFRGGGGVGLLLHAAALVGQSDDELGHGDPASRPGVGG